jgi:hypothetical protein
MWQVMAQLPLSSSQMLEMVQYNALMDVYEGLGSVSHTQPNPVFDSFFFIRQNAIQPHVHDSTTIQLAYLQSFATRAMSLHCELVAKPISRDEFC